MSASAHGFLQAWLDEHLPETDGDAAELARRCWQDALVTGIDLDSLEPEWGVSLEDIIREAIRHRDEEGQPE